MSFLQLPGSFVNLAKGPVVFGGYSRPLLLDHPYKTPSFPLEKDYHLLFRLG